MKLYTLIFMAMVLCACSASKTELIAAQDTSCGKLGITIGQLKQQHADAQAESIVANIAGVLSDDKSDQVGYGVESITNEVIEASAKKQLEQYMAIYTKKGC